LKEVIGAVFNARVLPAFKRLPGGGNGAVGQFFCAVMDAPDDLIELRGVDRSEQVAVSTRSPPMMSGYVRPSCASTSSRPRCICLGVTFIAEVAVRLVF
jgi:hypothetical protein